MTPSGLERALVERDLPLADRLALRAARHDRLLDRARLSLSSRDLRVVSELADPYGDGPETHLRTRVEFEGEAAAGGETPNGAVVLTSLVGGDAYAEEVGSHLTHRFSEPESVLARVGARLPRVSSNADLALLDRVRRNLSTTALVALGEAAATSESARVAAVALASTRPDYEEDAVTPAASALLSRLLRDTTSGAPVEWALRRALAAPS